MLKNGQAVTITPTNHELSTQEAADSLNVSRPFLYKRPDSVSYSRHLQAHQV